MTRVLCIALVSCAGFAACGGDTQIDLLPKPVDAGSGGAAGGTGGTGGVACPGGCSADLHCDTASGRCVQCLVALDCSNARACDPEGNCADPCTKAEQCTSSSKPVCDPGTGACVQCADQADCSEDPYCVKGRCVECTVNGDCAAAGTEKPFCSPITHECKQCLVNTDCPPPQTCDPEELQCKG